MSNAKRSAGATKVKLGAVAADQTAAVAAHGGAVSGAVSASAASQALATYDARPYFARALDHGIKNGIIEPERLDAMRTDGARGIVQIANFFGTAHLRTDLDDAMKRMVTLASLYLEHKSEGNLTRAARSLQEHTFLSHSRGGSEMLKALFALPADSTIDDPPDPEGVKEFLRARSLGDPWSVTEYRARLAGRRLHQAEIDAAYWFADVMGLEPEALMGESAESVIDACLLTRIAGRDEKKTKVGLLSAEEIKKFLKAIRAARKKPPIPKTVLDDVPGTLLEVVEKRLKKIRTKDLPRIADTKVAFGDLVREYHDRFHSFTLLSDISDYDALVTDEWRKVTQGKTDTDSMNTVFLCLAAGLPPKPAISAAEAKAAIKAIRAGGAAAKSVSAFIGDHAPHQMIDGLIALWEDEFLPEVIEQLIIDDAGDTPDALLRLLAEHCHIKVPARKA